jgi:CheY-like chemotaxis protein
MRINTLLIVDDSETSRMIIKRCWQIAGFIADNIIEAEDGLKALSHIVKGNIDYIITDINMPRMDGKTMIKKIRAHENSKDIPIAVISSMKNEEMAQTFHDLNVQFLLSKPLTPQKFLNTMGESNDSF